MKQIEKLNLLPEFNNNEKAIKDLLIKAKGSYDVKHYKKYWLNTHLERIFSKNNALAFAIKEYTKEEFEVLKSEENVRIEKIINIRKDMEIYSVTNLFVDFEEDKYDYFSIYKNGKKSISHFNIRIAK